MIANEIETTTRIWYGCYDGGWKDITPEAFQHPAKFAQGLVRKIFEYGLEKGYFVPGMTIIDPFGGVGLGAKYALANGLSWLGCELEKRFTDLGQGCDCTGISKADWVRFYGRWDKVAHTGGRYWCPQCLAEARKVNPPAPKSFTLSLFGDEPTPSAAYTRNSGIIPETKPHHYTGNLELFRKYAQPGTFAVLLNGDSRNLRQVIGQAAADGLLSSPPYLNGEKGHPSLGSVNKDNWGKDGRDIAGRRGLDGNYGGTTGQLGGMSEGSLADSLVTSPPFSPDQPCASQTRAKKDYHAFTRGDGTKRDHVMRSKENLDGLPMVGFDAALSSPPFAGNTGGRGEASRNGIDAALFDRHSGGMKKGTGDNPANLDHLPMGGLTDALLSSPPYEASLSSDDRKTRRNLFNGLDESGNPRGGKLREDTYGTTPGQLGTEQGTTFWAAARLIVSESYLALKPGAYTFWVVKRFVRDGAIVDFTYQWRQLCEACGFEFVEHIEASLIQSESKQSDLNGDVIKTKKKRASFFRRLHEKKFPHLAIDCEDILVMRKPL